MIPTILRNRTPLWTKKGGRMNSRNHPETSDVSLQAMASHDTNPALIPTLAALTTLRSVILNSKPQLTQHFASEADATGVDLSALAARVASLSAEELPSGVPPTGATLRAFASGRLDRHGSGGPASAWSITNARHLGFWCVGRQPNRLAGDGLGGRRSFDPRHGRP